MPRAIVPEERAITERTLGDLKAEHGVHLGGRHGVPKGEMTEQSPVRNYIRDLVLGFNDGLVSTFAITAGVAGALFSREAILITGLAATVAGALSMGAGEYISTKSQAEFYANERLREQEHLEKWPHLEIQELRESLEAKGIEQPLLEKVVTSISGNRERFLDYMMKDEFGVGNESERSPFRAALYVMIAFILGAIFPVLPYTFLSPTLGLQVSGLLSMAGLFAAGVVRARASRLPALRAGVEMVFVGVLAAAATFGVGYLVGVTF